MKIKVTGPAADGSYRANLVQSVEVVRCDGYGNTPAHAVGELVYLLAGADDAGSATENIDLEIIHA